MRNLFLFMDTLNFLDWWLLAAVLGLADVFVLRGWLVIAAIAAGIAGFVLMLFPQLAWGWQLGGFALLTLVGIAIRLLRRAKSLALVSKVENEEPNMSNFHDFKITNIDGQPKALKDFSGHPVLVVNVASECGLTPQYAGLEKLQREFGTRGFNVLGLPCNQFGQQEPGNEAEIKQFCETKYQVSFPLASKIEVNGDAAHPLYQWLKRETGGADIQWNFEKFLIGRDGRIVKRYSPKTVPEDMQLRADIEAAL